MARQRRLSPADLVAVPHPTVFGAFEMVPRERVTDQALLAAHDARLDEIAKRRAPKRRFTLIKELSVEQSELFARLENTIDLKETVWRLFLAVLEEEGEKLALRTRKLVAIEADGAKRKSRGRPARYRNFTKCGPPKSGLDGRKK